jgi:hypothetical protein
MSCVENGRRRIMNIDYAVERLYAAGWMPAMGMELDTLPDGRRCPSVLAVHQDFARAGLELSIKHNLIFNCYRATWAPIGEPLDESRSADARHGTVVGACEKEAAIYALAQLKEAQVERQLAAV